MSTADKLAKILETKLNIKQAITEKGVNVLDTDTFASYPEKIKAISGGGSGNTKKVYATNYSSTKPKKNDKVLIKYGTEASKELDTEFTIGNNSYAKNVHPMIFFDNNTIICSYGEKVGKRLEYIDNNWTNVSYPFEYSITKFTYDYTSNGIITSKAFNGTDSSVGYIIDKNNVIRFTNCDYLGSYNGVHYACGDSSDANDVFIFDYDNKAVTTTQVINGPSTRRNAFLRGDKIFLYSTTKKATLYQNIDGTYTKYADTTTSATETFVAVTGLEIGDYLFSITEPNAYYNLGTSASSYLKVFQIQETTGTYKAKVVEVTVPELEWLKTTDCRVTYDVRTSVLMVGTKDGVYGYKYNRGTFTDIQLNLGLPTTTGQTYMAVMSPMFNRILVSSPYIDTTYHYPYIIFALGEDGWSIVDNKTLNYQPEGVYTGYATGNINEEENKFEVEYLAGKGSPVIDW